MTKKQEGQPNTAALSAHLKSSRLGPTVAPLPLIAAPAPGSLPRQQDAPRACWPGRHFHRDAVAASRSTRNTKKKIDETDNQLKQIFSMQHDSSFLNTYHILGQNFFFFFSVPYQLRQSMSKPVQRP